MTYEEFLQHLIEDGIRAVNVDYANDEARRAGALAGFEACRRKSPENLGVLLDEARQAEHRMRFMVQGATDADIWRSITFAAEVDWVCNVVSAMLMNQGLKTIVTPTARGVMKAAEILSRRN